jgi:hypothetical protein
MRPELKFCHDTHQTPSRKKKKTKTSPETITATTILGFTSHRRLKRAVIISLALKIKSRTHNLHQVEQIALRLPCAIKSGFVV